MKIRKSMSGVTLAVVLLLAFVLCSAPSPAQDQKQPIVFGLIEPLSGPFKDVGTEVAAYVEYGVEQLNAAGGLLGRPVKLIQYDNQMKPDVAVRMGRKAVLEDGAKVIMSHTTALSALPLPSSQRN